MSGITLSSSATQLESLRQQFRTYAAWNHRDGAELFVDQSRKLATELYMQTAAIAPTKGEIAGDVRKQGWRIPRMFADGRIGRGVPAQWLGVAFSKLQKATRRRRGRPSKNDVGRRFADEDAFFAQKPTLQQMQDFVIGVRNAARLYLASGWLGSILDLGGATKASSGAVDRERGGATIVREPGRISVVLWNRTPGIELMESRTHFVEKAIAVRLADMALYIDRKRREAADKIFGRKAA